MAAPPPVEKRMPGKPMLEELAIPTGTTVAKCVTPTLVGIDKNSTSNSK